MSNKITYGLKNVYYAPIEEVVEDGEAVVEYGTPVRLPGASSLSLNPNVEKTPIAADDDTEYAIIYDNKGYEGDGVFHEVPDSFLVDCLGMTKDGETILENKDAEYKPFALLFEFDGDKKKRRHVMYRCTASKPSVSSQTKGNGITVNTATLTITATPAKDTGDIKRSCSESESEVYSKWFTTVPLSGGATVTE